MKKTIVLFVAFALFSCKSVPTQAPAVKAMNLKDLHIEQKEVQTSLLFVPTENKVVS